MSTELPPLHTLLETLPQVGNVDWIGLRPARRAPIRVVDQVEVTVESGLVGDRFEGRPGSNRQVTLIQKEHLDAVAGMLHTGTVDPALPRRNIMVSGINLLALKDKQFRVGEAVLQFTGLCHPCSRMEESLGPGGYNAMRGHGGITASVVSGGIVQVGDEVSVVPDPASS